MSKFSILLPSKLKIVQEDETKGVYEIDGLYPGYGHTLGNSLRRIILSSLPGAAITAVKITGADHEFATIPGIKEDAVTILLNLKKARFRVDSDEVQTINVKIGGPKVVTAGDLQGDNALVTVTNPDQYICEVTDTKATLEMELTVQQGMGYVSRENLFKEKVSVGTMTLDATFSPIRKVSYEVEDMRVGERTDHNRLRISVQTDGSMSPKAVLEESIKTMLAQMQAILDLKDIEESIPRIQRPDIITTGAPEESADTEDQKEIMADLLKTRVESLDVSTRTHNALAEANIRTVGGLVKKTMDELLELPGLGQKAVEEIVEALQAMDLDLKS